MTMMESKNATSGLGYYALSPGKTSPKESPVIFPRKDKDMNQYASLSMMESINTRVARRSAFLNSQLYGNNPMIREVSVSKSLLTSWLFIAGLMIFLVLARFSLTRGLLKKFLPKPGEGPTKQQREKGFFNCTVIGYDTSKSKKVVGKVKGSGDPGYKATSLMLGESALCLALQQDQLTDQYGIVTPASGMGQTLVDRLKKAGMTFDIVD